MSVVYKPWAQNWFSIFYIDFNQKVVTILKILNIDCIVNEFFHHIYKPWSFKFHFREQQQENYIYILGDSIRKWKIQIFLSDI